ncbi:MAG: STAS domain-containing protein [Spirochaetes bacterium]|nr:STAS domain-containing protein [Spirochaetota bacterium]
MEEALNITVEKREGDPAFVIFHLDGYLQANTLGQFEAIVESVLDQKIVNVIFDCKDVAFASSAALGSFMTIFERTEKENGKMIMASLSPPLAEVFELLDFYDIFIVVDSIQKAIDLVQGQGQISSFKDFQVAPGDEKKAEEKKDQEPLNNDREEPDDDRTD